MYNEGECELYMCAPANKTIKKITFQVAKISKVLGSVTQMVDHGHRVVFNTDRNVTDISYIENKHTLDRTWTRSLRENGVYVRTFIENKTLRRENGVYVMDMLIARPSFKQGHEKLSASGRPGAP